MSDEQTPKPRKSLLPKFNEKAKPGEAAALEGIYNSLPNEKQEQYWNLRSEHSFLLLDLRKRLRNVRRTLVLAEYNKRMLPNYTPSNPRPPWAIPETVSQKRVRVMGEAIEQVNLSEIQANKDALEKCRGERETYLHDAKLMADYKEKAAPAKGQAMEPFNKAASPGQER